MQRPVLQIFQPGPNVIKLFLRNYVAIGITSVKTRVKYAASGVNYALKKFHNTGHWTANIRLGWSE